MGFSDIINATDLNAYIGHDDWVILDCRAKKGVNHIQGAQSVNREKDLTGMIINGITGRHPLPRIDVFAELCSQWGIDKSKQVVIYDENSGAWASRLWWMMRWLGHENVAVLNGGWDNWVNEDLPITSGILSPRSQKFEVKEHKSWLVHRHDIAKVIQSTDTNLVDARAAGRYRGEFEPLDPIAGHIPTALNLPYTENLNEDGLWRSKEEMRKRLSPIFSVDDNQKTIFYCGSGVTACHNILASQYAGFAMPRLYVGSWSDWINTMN